MLSARERELKFDADDAFELPPLDGTPLAARRFTSTYVDTEDRRLGRLGITLRRRVEERRGVWQLKLPEAGDRREIEAPGGPARPPAELADLLVGVLRGRELLPVARLRTRRTGVDVGGVEVTVDDVAVLDGRSVVGGFREIEAEVVAGDGDGLAAIGRRLRRAGAEPRGLVPKLSRVVGPPPDPDEPPLDGEAEAFRAALREQVRTLLAHDPGTRLGADPEALHDMRVAVRRLRAFLRVGGPALDPDWAGDLRERLRRLGGELGPARDLDVLVERIRAETDGLDGSDARAARRLVGELERRRAEARSALVAALRSEPYLTLLDDLEEAARAPKIVAPVELERWAGRAYARLRAQARAITDTSPDDELHDVRKTGKRARYAAELAEPVAGKRARRFVREAKRFQTTVGEHQDAAVAEAELRELAAGRSGSTALVAGRLVERMGELRRAARAAYPKAWARLRKAGKSAWG